MRDHPVGIDSRNFGITGGTGVATYARSVEQALLAGGRDVARLDAGDSAPGLGQWVRRHKLALCHTRRAIEQASGAFSCPEINASAHIRFGLSGGLTRVRPDRPLAAMHLTYPLPFIVEECTNLVTVHDIIPCLQPDLTPVSGQRISSLIKALAGERTIFLTVSDSTQGEIISHFRLAPERVINLSQPVSFSDADRMESESAERIFPAGSFVFFGTIERRKNIARLIEAHGRSGTRRPLGLVGADGFGASEAHSALEGHPRPELIIRRPWCDRPQLIRAIREARAVVFPSLAEGFGLPVIEGMALGTPVMTSRGGATEEVAGRAAMLVDPRDVAMMADTLETLDRDDALCARLAQRGALRAAAFSLAAFSERLNRLHDRLAAGGRILTSEEGVAYTQQAQTGTIHRNSTT